MVTFSSLLALFALTAEAKQLISVEEALKSIYPGCEARTETKYLSVDQVKDASKRAGSIIESAVVIRYAVKCPERPHAADERLPHAEGGYAYTDTHRVRTHPETLLIALDGAGRVLRVEVLGFDEPIDYMPKGQWYKTFERQKLDSELALKRAIPLVTGASLTSRATTDATRRVLALHEVLGK